MAVSSVNCIYDAAMRAATRRYPVSQHDTILTPFPKKPKNMYS